MTDAYTIGTAYTDTHLHTTGHINPHKIQSIIEPAQLRTLHWFEAELRKQALRRSVRGVYEHEWHLAARCDARRHRGGNGRPDATPTRTLHERPGWPVRCDPPSHNRARRRDCQTRNTAQPRRTEAATQASPERPPENGNNNAPVRWREQNETRAITTKIQLQIQTKIDILVTQQPSAANHNINVRLHPPHATPQCMRAAHSTRAHRPRGANICASNQARPRTSTVCSTPKEPSSWWIAHATSEPDASRTPTVSWVAIDRPIVSRDVGPRYFLRPRNRSGGAREDRTHETSTAVHVVGRGAHVAHTHVPGARPLHAAAAPGAPLRRSLPRTSSGPPCPRLQPRAPPVCTPQAAPPSQSPPPPPILLCIPPSPPPTTARQVLVR